MGGANRMGHRALRRLDHRDRYAAHRRKNLLSLFLHALGIRLAAGLLEGAAEEELDLRVETAQIIVRPPLDGLQQGRVDTEKEGFTLRHSSIGRSFLR